MNLAQTIDYAIEIPKVRETPVIIWQYCSDCMVRTDHIVHKNTNTCKNCKRVTSIGRNEK